MSDEYIPSNILHNLAVRVGQLEGSVKTFMENWSRQDQIAHESRRVMYDRIDLIGKQVDRVATDVQNMQQDIAEMKKEVDERVMPVIETVKGQGHRSAGVKSVWAVIGAGVVMLASALAYVADKITQYLPRNH